MANQYKNKVIYNGEPLIDLTSDTVSAATLLEGETAHDRSGAPITGTFNNYVKADLADDETGNYSSITHNNPAQIFLTSYNYSTERSATVRLEDQDMRIEGHDISIGQYYPSTPFYNANVTIHGVVTPTTDDMAANKAYVDAAIPTVPTKVSDLTNDSGFITSYTETDPVFSASAAAGITSTDITNWNNKVSDTGKWNGVSLEKTSDYGGADVYIPYLSNTSATAAKLVEMRDTVSNRTIAVRTANGYLTAATPPANSNNTNVATTAYVKAAIPTVPTKVSDLTNDSGFISSYTQTDPVFSASTAAGITPVDISNWNSISRKVNKSGDTMTGDLSFGDSTEIKFIKAASSALNTPERTIAFKVTGQSGAGNTAYTNFAFSISPSSQEQTIQIKGIHTPTGSNTETYIASKQYVDNQISALTIPTAYNVSTNPNGYLTMSDLPIYDGTVN